MNLFRRRRNSAAAPDNTFKLAPTREELPEGEIALSAEEKGMLKEPLDPRVDRILRGIYADRAAADAALKGGAINSFPSDDSGDRQVVPDADKSWRIVPAPGSTKTNECFDAL
jgi:hypothetical protein